MRAGLLVLGVTGVLTADAQMLHKRNLVCTLGAGMGLVGIQSSWVSFAEGDHMAGTVDLAFGYAIAERWTLGIHYQRLGMTQVGQWNQGVRITLYELEGSWRAFDDGRSTIQVLVGTGASVPSFRSEGQGLPAETVTSSLSTGIRYLLMLSNVVGWSATLNGALGNTGALTRGSDEVHDPDGDQVTIGWSAISLSSGVFVRF